jgi:hypothetical protein
LVTLINSLHSYRNHWVCGGVPPVFHHDTAGRRPAGVELHASRGELADPVAEIGQELERVAEEGAGEDPPVVVLELGDGDAVLGEQKGEVPSWSLSATELRMAGAPSSARASRA